MTPNLVKPPSWISLVCHMHQTFRRFFIPLTSRFTDTVLQEQPEVKCIAQGRHEGFTLTTLNCGYQPRPLTAMPPQHVVFFGLDNSALP